MQTAVNQGILLVATALWAAAAAGADHQDAKTHCAVRGYGIAVVGKSLVEKKLACGKITGSIWSEAKSWPITAGPPPPNDESVPHVEPPSGGG